MDPKTRQGGAQRALEKGAKKTCGPFKTIAIFDQNVGFGAIWGAILAPRGAPLGSQNRHFLIKYLLRGRILGPKNASQFRIDFWMP